MWANAGGDWAANASVVSLTPINGPAVWSSTPAFVGDVQMFLDQPAQNFGWLLKRDNELAIGEVRRFDSRSISIASRRPMLTITYLPAGGVMSVGTGCTGSNAQPLALAAQGLPGPSFGVAISGGQSGALAALAVSLGLAMPPVPVYAGCSLLLDPLAGIVTHALLTLDGSGYGALPFPVPNGFHGLEVDLQALALDGVLPVGFVLSNGLRLVAQ
jgi:hypothetical protein